jgi:hypothetical protein
LISDLSVGDSFDIVADVELGWTGRNKTWMTNY